MQCPRHCLPHPGCTAHSRWGLRGTPAVFPRRGACCCQARCCRRCAECCCHPGGGATRWTLGWLHQLTRQAFEATPMTSPGRWLRSAKAARFEGVVLVLILHYNIRLRGCKAGECERLLLRIRASIRPPCVLAPSNAASTRLNIKTALISQYGDLGELFMRPCSSRRCTRQRDESAISIPMKAW